MNFSHYLGLVESEKVEQFIFAQGNRPAAKLNDGHTQLLSEVFLFKEDLAAIETELLNLIGPDIEKRFFYLNGLKFKFEMLNLSDSTTICVKPISSDSLEWNSFMAPGYVQDWVESNAGLIVFYGSDADLVEEVRKAFAAQRVQKTKGKSLVFSEGPALEEVSDGEHFITSSSDEQSFLKVIGSAPKFGSYFFKGDIASVGSKNLVRLCDRGALVVFNSFWSDIDAVWTEIVSHLDSKFYKDFVLRSITGFVGVRATRTVDGDSTVVFEALPVHQLDELSQLDYPEQIKTLKKLMKTDGVSFNQSLHSMVLKRQVSLESAYAASSNPEELNAFLSESGI